MCRSDIIKLWIVIPEYNDWENTRQCLSSLYIRDSNLREKFKINIIVISHGFDRTCLDEGPLMFPYTEFLPGLASEWWTATSNRGIRRALEFGATHVMLLNSDCKFEKDGFSRLLTQASEFPDEILSPSQVDNLTGEAISSYFRPFLLAGFISLPRFMSVCKRLDEGESLVEVFAVAGGRGVIIPSKVFFSIGLLDEERFPHYYGDHDFFLRCREISVKQRILSSTIIYVGENAVRAKDVEVKRKKRTLKKAHSHLLYRDVSAFFRKHYPISFFYHFGIFLFYLRVALVSVVRSFLPRTFR